MHEYKQHMPPWKKLAEPGGGGGGGGEGRGGQGKVRSSLPLISSPGFHPFIKYVAPNSLYFSH